MDATGENKHWVSALLQWYARARRPLPWRETSDPYRIWVSEAMLQQTQVDTVVPYYVRFLERFPTLDALATADQQTVLKLWEGLGYYSRARNFHRAAREVGARFEGVIPQSYEALQTLPGLGPYTAAAVASIAFGEAVPVVDGNVLRVFARFWGITEDIRHAGMRQQLFERLTPIIADAPPAEFNQAIMELGALQCRKVPRCEGCPLQARCVAFAEARVDELPVKSRRPPVPHKEIAVGVIWRGDKLLIGKRRSDQMLGGLWEFPGGKRNLNESLAEAALREIREETGLTVRIVETYCQVKHAYTHFKITLTAFRCEHLSGEAHPNNTDELRWVAPDELDRFPFPRANKKIIAAIRELSRS